MPTAKPPSEPEGWISAAADGDPEALDRACRAFCDDDPRARADWHAYHLIGDVLRSAELASRPERDQAFLAAVRERLAAEPVVLAPAAMPRALPRIRWWRLPTAAAASAAGVAVVAGVLVMARSGPESENGTPGGAPLALTATPPPTSGVPVVVRDGFIRDARIEEFMRVHQGAAGGLSLPRVDVRQVDVTVAQPVR